jgi:hypothetical protein
MNLLKLIHKKFKVVPVSGFQDISLWLGRKAEVETTQTHKVSILDGTPKKENERHLLPAHTNDVNTNENK